MFKSLLLNTSIICGMTLISGTAYAQTADDDNIDEIIVTGQAKTYAEVATNQNMIDQQNPITSVLAVIDNLPGVNIGEGDGYGFDDWSTSIHMRGFQNSLSEQQIGITIDGLPNGNSNYGGGAKANRYIDTPNIQGVDVAQGTADIASLSNEALGGTLNFITQDPLEERRIRLSGSVGEYKGRKAYARYDTGLFLNDSTRAWVSASTQSATDFITESAQNKRDHAAFKIISDIDDIDTKVTAYGSFDDTEENNYQRIYSAAQFAAFPNTDGLTGTWSGTPDLDQAYREVWGTKRSNSFAYLKAEKTFFDSLKIDAAAYYHANSGRGDWAPPYIAQVFNDGAGNRESELGIDANGVFRTAFGGTESGTFNFVDANGVALSPIAGCTPSGNLGAYGPLSAANDPTCYPAGAIAVQSYRHTHYEKKRQGYAANFSWDYKGSGEIENTLRGGLWYEDSKRKESRDWHKGIDTRVGPEFEDQAYWQQYKLDFPISTFKWYLEDSLTYGPLTATLGIKQFQVSLNRKDILNSTQNGSVESNSDVLFSGGLVYRTPIEGLEAFAGYAENFASIKDGVLERPASELGRIQPETAQNIDFGLRYKTDRFNGSLTYYDITFDNRIIFISPETETGPSYLVPDNGAYFNAGGIASNGVEAAGTYYLNDEISLYSSFTYNDTTYLGTDDAEVDETIGITPGNVVAGAPEIMFVGSANWKRGPYALGVSGKYTGERFADQNNAWEVDSNFIVDLNASITGDAISDSLDGMELSLVINNLFDESYLGTISSNAAWIGAPRTAVLTLTADF